MKSSGPQQFTDEQLKRMEENRLKALQKRAERLRAETLASGKNNVASFRKQEHVNYKTTQQNTPNLSGSTNTRNVTQSELIKKINVQNQNEIISPATVKPVKPPVAIQGKCVIINRTRFRIDVGYHKELIEIFKTIPSKFYDPVEKKWDFLIEHHNQLMTAATPLKSTVSIVWLPATIVKLFQTFQNEKTTENEVDLSSLNPVLRESLMPFQRIGVSYGISRDGRVLIADDMGLGKTIQAIAIADYYRSEWPLLVVTPSSMRYSWLEAFRTWLPSLSEQEITVLNTSKDQIGRYKVYITSYDLMTRRSAELESKAFKVVIMDESHHLKNYKAARTKSAKEIVAYANRLILLSGTPALSKPVELYIQICMVNKSLFPNFQSFGIRYCDGKKGPWAWDYNGATHTTELLLIIEEKIMIRRLKADVMKQLPSKIRQMIVLDPTDITTADKNMKYCSQQLADNNLKGMERRGMLITYYQETSKCKSKAVCAYISDLLERGEKFLCFAHHRIMMDNICQTLEKKKIEYIRIDGTTPPEMRKQNVDKFQFRDNCLVAVLSITAASTGLTLTRAKLVIFAELFWNPGILTQAEDRAHRIGQESSVLIQYLVAKGTADDHLWLLIRNKLEVLNKVGLSKDNFYDADTKMMDKRQLEMTNFFEIMDFDFENFDETLESPVKKCKLT